MATQSELIARNTPNIQKQFEFWVNDGGFTLTVKYGILYNFATVEDVRGISSGGTWGVPSSTDWDDLGSYLGGSSVAGGKLKESGTLFWNSPNIGAENSTNFNGRGGGNRDDSGFLELKDIGAFLSKTEYDTDSFIFVALGPGNIELYLNATALKLGGGQSIRLFRPATPSEQLQADGTPCEPYTGNDLKRYRTTKVGSQVWLADNLCETKFSNGDTIPLVTDPTAWAELTTAGMCYYDNDITNAFTLTSTAIKLDFAPDGWDNDEYFLQRDLQSFGVFRKFTVGELMFVKDGRDYLLNAYEAQGVNMEVTLTVLENTPSGTQRTRFVGKVDGSTAKRTELSFNCQIKDGSFTDLVLDRAKTEINLNNPLSIDNESIGYFVTDDIIMPELTITQTANWTARDTTEVLTESHSLQVTLINGEYPEAQSTVNLFDVFFDAATVDYLNSTFEFDVVAEINETAPLSDFTINFYLEKINGGATDILFSDSYNSVGQYPYTKHLFDTITALDIVTGDKLKFRAEFDVTSGGASIQYTSIQYNLKTPFLTIEQSTFKGALYFDAFERIIEAYTGNSGRFKSSIFTVGDALKYLGVFTTGREIRKQTGLNNTFPLSLDNAFTSLQRIYNLGLGVELVEGVEKVVIEEMAYFFNSTIILDISDRIAPETITKEYFKELAYNRITAGFNSFDYGTLGGVYEFNTNSKFTTCLKNVDKQLDLVSPYRADMSGYLALVQESAQNRDVSGEADVYIIDVEASGADYIVKTVADNFEDYSNRDILFNVELSPSRIIRRWGSYIRGFLEKYKTNPLIYQTSEKNNKLDYGGIAETDNIIVSDLTAPLWHCEIFTIEVPALENDITAINANMYGLVKLTATEYGWILSYKSKNENRKSEFTLLRCNTDFVTPETSNRILTGNNEFIIDLNNNYITWRTNTI